MTKFTPTKEQQDIVEKAKEGDSFKISAFAGASKTTTLCLIAEEMHVPTLYLAYNRRMAEEARYKFPEHVTVKTTHSVAYGEIGVTYSGKLSRPKGGYVNVAWTPSEIARFFRVKPYKMTPSKVIGSAAIGKMVKDTVSKFEYSKDKHISEKHLVMGEMYQVFKKANVSRKKVEELVIPLAKKLWNERVNLDSEVMISHDTYLKLYQLSKPDLSKYDIIMLDEAQDSNDCVMDIVSRQKGVQTILVGDEFQSIYAWRGAVDAISNSNMHGMTLSKSFRFGDEVSNIANTILSETTTCKVLGCDVDSKVHSPDSTKEIPFPQTRIYRTNSFLLEEALDILEEGKYDVYIEIDFRDLISSLKSALSLFEGDLKAVKHESFIGYNTWQDAVDVGKFMPEIKRLVKLVENGKAEKVITLMENYEHPEEYDIMMITAHKAKGLEWDVVVVASDFPEPYDGDDEYDLPDQERNLLYVAHTRGKNTLVYNYQVCAIINHRNAKQ